MDPLISHAWILSDRLGVPCRRICVGAECHKTEDVGKSQGLRSKRCFTVMMEDSLGGRKTAWRPSSEFIK